MFRRSEIRQYLARDRVGTDASRAYFRAISACNARDGQMEIARAASEQDDTSSVSRPQLSILEIPILRPPSLE